MAIKRRGWLCSIMMLAICTTTLFPLASSQMFNMFTSLMKFLSDGERQLQKESIEKPLLREYDFIVIGAGTAGCAIANRLTEIPEWKVLLVEAGDSENFVMDIPIVANYLQFTKANWKYKTVPSERACLGFDKKQCNWPRGKVMGGSSVLNYMIYTRGNKRDYDQWEKQGNPGWGWDSVLPYFKKVENYQIEENFNPAYHGNNGYLDVSYAPFRTTAAKAWIQAAQEAGHRKNDYNGKTQTGVSYLQLSLSNGTRHSSNRAYILPVKERPNLHVIKNTMVTKIVIDKNKIVTGIEVMRRNRRYKISASKEVIVSGGAVNSPQLLMLSGIGPAEDLEKLNIPVVQNLKVGYNLMDHIAAGGLTFTLNPQNMSLATGYILSHPQYIFDWMNKRSGPLSIPGGCEAVTFIDLKNQTAEDGWADMELLFIGGSVNGDPLLRRNFGFTDDIFETVYNKLGNKQSFMVFPMLMRPKSKGRIQLKSKNPLSYPLIQPNYFAYEEDIKTMVAGIRAAIKIAEQPTLKKMGAKLYSNPIPQCLEFGFGTDAYWACHAMYFTFTIYHASGTCKMGPETDPGAVVDPRLRVHGIRKLRVVDASIIPEIPSGHTNSPVYMIAEKASDMIKEDWGMRVINYS